MFIIMKFQSQGLKKDPKHKSKIWPSTKEQKGLESNIRNHKLKQQNFKY